jgi:hypothetical protein
MASKIPAKKQPTPPAKKAVAKSSNKPGPMDDLGRAAKKVGGLLRVPLVREKRTLMPTKANPSMGPLGKTLASTIKKSGDPTKYLPGAATTGRAAANALVAKKQKALMDSKKKK